MSSEYILNNLDKHLNIPGNSNNRISNSLNRTDKIFIYNELTNFIYDLNKSPLLIKEYI